MRHANRRGKVEHAVGTGDEPLDEFVVEDAALDEMHGWIRGAAREVAAPAGRQIVQHRDGVARFGKTIDEVAADETGASSHQRPHTTAP